MRVLWEMVGFVVLVVALWHGPSFSRGSSGVLAAEEGAFSRESLRYDGHGFEWWIHELRTELKPELRSEAVRAMGTFGTCGYSEEATTAIVNLFKSHEMESRDKDDEMVRAAATRALRKIGPVATTLLVDVLAEENANTRRFALTILSSFPRSDQSLAAIIRATKDEDLQVRCLAVTALAKGGKGAVAALTATLRDKDMEPRYLSARALGQIGEDASAAVPALVAALEDQRVEVRQNAVEALQAIGADPATVVPAFVGALDDPDDKVRQNAIRALRVIGPEAKDAVPALIEAFKQVHPEERQRVLDALVRIVPEKEDSLESLRQATAWWRSDDPMQVDEITAEVLRRIAK